jgi:hypothetical protein
MLFLSLYSAWSPSCITRRGIPRTNMRGISELEIPDPSRGQIGLPFMSYLVHISHIPWIYVAIVTVLDCSTRFLFTMGLFYSQIVNTTTELKYTESTLKQYLNEQSSYSSSLLHVLICTPREHSISWATSCLLRRLHTVGHQNYCGVIECVTEPTMNKIGCCIVRSWVRCGRLSLTFVVRQLWSAVLECWMAHEVVSCSRRAVHWGAVLVWLESC